MNGKNIHTYVLYTIIIKKEIILLLVKKIYEYELGKVKDNLFQITRPETKHVPNKRTRDIRQDTENNSLLTLFSEVDNKDTANKEHIQE